MSFHIVVCFIVIAPGLLFSVWAKAQLKTLADDRLEDFYTFEGGSQQHANDKQEVHPVR
jgi:hypothetical protein